ncbi:hypothetical protein [Micromonospora aurantiaca (nom. illeg.)]
MLRVDEKSQMQALEGWLCPRCLSAAAGRRDREKGWARTNPRP